MTLRIGSICLASYRQEAFDKIYHHLTKMEADLLILSNFRTGMDGMLLRGHLDRMGLVYQTPVDTNPDEYALILGSRFPFLQHDLPTALKSHCRECVQVCVSNINLIAFDLSEQRPDSPVEHYLLSQAVLLQRDRTLFIGRSPEAAHRSEESTDEPPADGLMKALLRLGFIDASQLHKSASARPSDVSPKGPVNAFVTPALAPQMSERFHEQDAANGSPAGSGVAVLRVS